MNTPKFLSFGTLQIKFAGAWGSWGFRLKREPVGLRQAVVVVVETHVVVVDYYPEAYCKTTTVVLTFSRDTLQIKTTIVVVSYYQEASC